MNRNWIRKHNHKLLASLLFFVLFSLLSWKGISFGEDGYAEPKETIQITHRFSNKTAIQVEESITKPWEQILKSISGYKQIESISEVGRSMFLLQLDSGTSKQEIVQSIRNEYLLQKHKFPKDSHFPQIQSGKTDDSYLIILQRIHKGSDSTRKDLERKIRNLDGVLSFVHHSDKEQELVLEFRTNQIQTSEFPSLSIIFSSLRKHSFGFSLDKWNGYWFQKDNPLKPMDWSEVPISSNLGNGLKVSAIGKVSLKEREVRHGTRINGSSSETIIIKAKNSTSLYYISKELTSILSNHTDWILLYTSHEDLIRDLFRFFFLFFILDLVLVIFCSFLDKSGSELVINLLSYYISLILFLGICNLLNYPMGRAILWVILAWKYLLFVFPIRRIGVWLRGILFPFVILSLFVVCELIPKDFVIFSFCHIYFLLSFSFFKILFAPLRTYQIPVIKIVFWERLSCFSKIQSGNKSENLWLNKYVVSGLFLLGVISSLMSSFDFHRLGSFQGNILMAKLEFPTSVPEEESIRITKQVEDFILKQKMTDLLVVKQNPSSADFYFRLKELGSKSDFRNLPTESGYFHISGDKEINSNQRLRFANGNTEAIEKTILTLLPWLQNKLGVEEIVLCFQPSSEGIELNSSSKFRNLLGFDWDHSLRERSLALQSAIVGKMIWNHKLTDVRFSVLQEKELERFSVKPTKLNSGTSLYSESFIKSEKVKIPGRIYRKNGETSLEILLKGKKIQWKELESKIHKLLENGEVQLSEMTLEKTSDQKYQPFYLFCVILVFLYRKKEKCNSWIQILCLILVWRMNVSILSDDYLLFGSVGTVLMFLILFSPLKTFSSKKNIPTIFLLLVFYFLPGDGGKFFLEGLILIFVFFILQSKFIHQWKFFKTKHSF
ncbi:efflux RND transporter permease subunit [Leptospira congkakensis]|uniref:Efflux RND transporter permease subunit n=1 Tax=Leptospira congkakensis TaxID=2484932 RepID=A0A4Z1A2F2_9LEPT|nr:efflux RND transporter permease subunit [Leptospira congkakensis]TGL87870.1 efflux RND transporter permease subunit [Leptospira congkakensis]TGL92647.1 efflux RND transporter permease subunit [Leptospira congkakensis]TGL96020.1 efflux RND transporter permease subunit [Leptospira congkakensis]